ncbi:MAG TPA: protein-disulfide reductase DsbD [Pseudorhodoplanes sp.]|nr:protein-disulfide reductase DsbD [Steroidobacteraceae bacterium]HVX98930.1 protein-disulfide reductase DsbD [Pseudorhodoplanes sp.]
MSTMRFWRVGWLAWLVFGAVTAFAADGATDMPSAGGINAILGAKQSAEPEFLPPDEAFQVAAEADGPGRVRVEWAIHEGYYLYKSRIHFATTDPQVQLGTPSLPTGKKKHDEYFGDQEVYHDGLVATVPITVPGGAGELPLDVTYQGCAEAGLCYPPITKNLKVSLGGDAAGASSAAGATAAGKSAGSSTTAAASAARDRGGYVSEQDRLAGLLRDGNLAAVLATFFSIGVLLSFTPCVLPMIPILSGLIVGQGEKVTATRGFSLAFTYVQGMALTYAAAGAAFVLLFKQAPQAFFQQPWMLALFAALFVALALAMFGAYTLQLPSALQTRLTGVSNKQKSGTYSGTFIMGALSALVVTACVAPALIAALSVISQTGQVARGAAALYVTGLGMGVPLLLVGASAGSLLPRVGPWMDTVKSLFGVLFLGVAIYFVQPLLPPAIAMLLWSALAVVSGFWIFSLKARDGGPAPAAVRAPGLLAVVYGIILLIGVAAGGTDPVQPLSPLRLGSTAVAAGSGPQDSGLSFETIKSVGDLKQRVAAASAAGKPVMLDFYADWCVSCKEMEKYTFTDPSVQAALRNAVLLRADVTRNDADDQALLQHFGIFGPPTIAFYDPSGQEQRNFRVVGYMKAPEFATVLRQAFAGGGKTS